MTKDLLKSNLYMFECKKTVIDKKLRDIRKDRLRIMRQITELKRKLKKEAA